MKFVVTFRCSIGQVDRPRLHLKLIIVYSGARKESKIGVSVNPDILNLGKIHVSLIEAKDLSKTDMIGKSDPYAIISHGNQKFKTNTVKNSQNPKWNYDADFNVPDQGDDRIKVDIFDSDRIGKDKPLGSAFLDVDEVMSKGIMPPAWYPLKGTKSGEVLMSADFEPMPDGRMTSPEPRGRMTSPEPRASLDRTGEVGGRVSILGQPDIEDGILHVDLLGARNLIKADLIGKSDPYAVLALGDQIHKTDPVKNSQNPEWNYGADFSVGPHNPDNLKINVYDKDKYGKDKSLGSTKLPVRELINETDPNVSRWLPLDGVKSGEVLVVTNFQPLEDEKSYDKYSGRGRGQSIANKNGDPHGNSSIISVNDDVDDNKTPEYRGMRGLKQKLSSGSLFDDNTGRKDSVMSTTSTLGGAAEIPHGTVHLALNQAKNLVNADLVGKSDPYAVITCGKDKSKTKTIRNNLNPVWNHEADFPVDDSTPRLLKIHVFDHDHIGKDKPIGSVDIDLEDLVNNGPLNNEWLPLKNAKSGDVQVSADFRPANDNTRSPSRGRDSAKASMSGIGSRQSTRDSLDSGANDLPRGMLDLDVIKARDLTKADVIGKSDPYALVSFGGDKMKTPVVKNNQNPEWNFNANIPIDENGPRNVRVEVFDSDKFGKDKPIGSTNIDVEDIVNGKPLNKDWLPLDGAKSGKIQLSADFIPESELNDQSRRPSRGRAGVEPVRDGGRQRKGSYDDDDGDYASSPTSRKSSRLAGRRPSDISEIPAGTLHFGIQEAKDLVKGDIVGKSDPYAVLTYGAKQVKTEPVKNNQNPKWNFEGDIPVEEGGPKIINLEVFDADKFGKDKSLGKTNLDVMDIVHNSPIDDTWVPLDGVKSGKVKISANFTPEDGDLAGSHPYGAGKGIDPRLGSKVSSDPDGYGGSRKSSGQPSLDISGVMPGPGVAKVKVNKAKDLAKADVIGKSDPYVTISSGSDRKKSKVVKNNQNPEWNFEVDIPVDDTSPKDIKIEVFDSDRFGKDKPLGNASIDIQELANNEPLDEVWIPLQGSKNGQIQVSAEYTPSNENKRSPREVDYDKKPSGQGSRKNSEQDIMKQDKPVRFSSPGRHGRPVGAYEDLPAGKISLEIAEGRNLVNMDIVGKSDPYAVVTFGNDQLKTKTIKNNHEPEWNFKVDLPVDPHGPSNINIEIWDEDKHTQNHKPMGSTDIDLNSLLNDGPLKDKWLPLENVEHGEIKVSADYQPESRRGSRSGATSPYGRDAGRKPMEKKPSRERMVSPGRKTSGGSDGLRSPDRKQSGGSVGRKTSDKSPTVVPGNLHLNIIQGKDLIKGDIIGKSDPYAVVTYGNDKIKTNAVKNTQNPNWNFETDIPLLQDGPDIMNIEIFDSDRFGKDKSLGATNIDIPSLQHSQSLSNIWVPLDNVKSGQIKLSADFSPDPGYDSRYGSDPTNRNNPDYRKDSVQSISVSRKSSQEQYFYSTSSSRKSSQEQQPGYGGTQDTRGVLAGRRPSENAPNGSGEPRHSLEDKLGTIQLDLLCAKDLIKTDIIGKSDPYAVIQYGDQKFTTPVKKNTQNPEFNIQCNIEIPSNPKERNINILIYDSDKIGKDKCIGDMNIDIAKVMNLGKLQDDWYPLDGVKSGEIKIGATFTPDSQDSSLIEVHQTFTESRRSSTQFHEITLDRIPLPSAAGGIIEAYIRRPSGIIDKPLMEEKNNGTLSIKYQPTEDGLHFLDVTLNGEQVQGSPFKFHVHKQNSGQAYGYGPGLTHGVCGEPAKFDISTKGAGAGGLSLAVEGPSKAEISCVDNKDGTVSVSYLPTAPGEYRIIAKFADKHIPGSPFTCKVTGDNKKKNQISVGSSSELQLPGDLSEADIRSLKAFIESPSGGIEQCFLKKLPKGNIGISFTPREVGEHLVSVQKNGAHIANSPFKIVVNQQEVGDASRVKVSGDGLEHGKTHEYNKFQINTKSAGYGGLSLSIEGPSKAEIECKDNEDGTLDVDYKPTEPGFYIVNIKFADSHIPGSPFQVPISGEGLEKKRENLSRMREAVPVTEVGSSCRLTFKMPGINMKDLEANVKSPSGKVG